MVLYYVVEFDKDHSVYVVPEKWLFDNNTKCKWPEGVKDKAKINSMVLKGTDPTENPRFLWKTYDCLVLLGSDNFKAAQKGAEKALETSEFELTDVESVVTTGSRVLRAQVQKTVVKVPPSTSSIAPRRGEHEPTITDPSVDFPEFEVGSFYQDLEQQEVNLVLPVSTASTATQDVSEVRTPFPPDLPGRNQLGLELSPLLEATLKVEKLLEEFRTFRLEFEKFKTVVVERLVKVGSELDHVSLTLGRYLISSLRVEELGLPVGVSLALKDGKELAVLQRWLDARENQIKLSNYLRGIGGSDLKDCMRRILERLFAAALARSVNFIGTNGKISFKNHHLRCCLIAALGTDPQSATPTEADVDKCVQKWFGGSGDRNGGRAARKQSQPELLNSPEDSD